MSQTELVKALGVDIPYSNISKYELDKNEAPIDVLLAYARLVNAPLEQLVDDELDLTIK